MRLSEKQKQPAPPPYVHQDFPRMLYREGAPRPIVVKDEAEEARMTEQGWGRTPVEPPAPFVPQTDTEIALDRQARAHKADVDRLVERYSEEMRQVRVQHEELSLRHLRLKDANEGMTVRHEELAKQNEALVNEVRAANERADDLVKQLAAATTELDELRRRAAASRAVQGAQNKKEN